MLWCMHLGHCLPPHIQQGMGCRLGGWCGHLAMARCSLAASLAAMARCTGAHVCQNQDPRTVQSVQVSLRLQWPRL